MNKYTFIYYGYGFTLKHSFYAENEQEAWLLADEYAIDNNFIQYRLEGLMI